jgi:hypothetical protein
MGDACAAVVIVLLLCAAIGYWHQSLSLLHPSRLWRWWRQRAERRFYREMCRRWGNEPIPRWHHDERERSREMRQARAHKTRS